MQFKNAAELQNYIQKHVQKSMKTYVADNIKSTQVEMIEDNVYGVYSEPVVYQRRMYDGGLADPDNMKVTFDGHYLRISNQTHINVDYPVFDYCDIKIPNNLVALVEYGDGGSGGEYTHKHSMKPQGPTFLAPRPFIHPTIEQVARGQQHVNGLMYGLLKAGFTVKRK